MKQKQEAAKSLPKLGCDLCAPFAPGLVGYVIEQKPGQGREVSPCACRIAREKAKREAAA